MKNLVITLVPFLVFYCFPSFSNAQHFTIKWGPDHPRVGSDIKVLDYADQYYYVHSRPGSDEIITIYDANHHETAKLDIYKEVDQSRFLFRDLIRTKIGTYAYFFNRLAETGKWQIDIAPVINGKLGSLQLVKDENYQGSPSFNRYHSTIIPFLGYRPNQQPEIAISANRLFVAILSPIITSKTGGQQVGIKIFNEEMQLLWSQLINLNEFGSSAIYTQAVLSDDGELILVVQSKPNAPINYSLINITKEGNKILPVTMPIATFPDDIRVFFSQKTLGQIYLAGFYSKQPMSGQSDGLLTCSFNFNCSEIVPRQFSFTDTMSQHFVIDPRGKKPPFIPANIYVDYMHEFENGNYAFSAESRGNYATSVQTTGPDPIFIGSSVYDFANLVIPFFNKSGELIKYNIIKRNYAVPRTDINGYNFGVSQNKMLIAFADGLQADELKKLPKGDKSYHTLRLLAIEETGHLRSYGSIRTFGDRVWGFLPVISSVNADRLLVSTNSINNFSVGYIFINNN